MQRAFVRGAGWMSGLVSGGEDSFNADGVLQSLRGKGAQVGKRKVGLAISPEVGAQYGEGGCVLVDGK